MKKEDYKKLVNGINPKEDQIKNMLIAFFIGGLIGVLGQGLTDFYTNCLSIPSKMASSCMIVTFIFLGCLFTSLGFFDNWVKWAKAGLIIPITGFAHSMMSAALEYRKEGLVTGIGANMFKLAGTVIVYGVSSAWLFGLIRLLIGG